jgi:hypothetical protein
LITLIAQILLFLGYRKIERFALLTGTTPLQSMKPTLTKMNLQLKPIQVGRQAILVDVLLQILLETPCPSRRVVPLGIHLDVTAPLRFKLPKQDLLGVVALVRNRILSTLFSRSFCSLVDKKGEM